MGARGAGVARPPPERDKRKPASVVTTNSKRAVLLSTRGATTNPPAERSERRVRAEVSCVRSQGSRQAARRAAQEGSEGRGPLSRGELPVQWAGSIDS